MAGNPFFLIKARMQAYNPVLPVGTQHNYKHSWDALRSVWKAERWRGLIRGMDAAIIRTAMGSSVSAPGVFITRRGCSTLWTRRCSYPVITGPNGLLSRTDGAKLTARGRFWLVVLFRERVW